MSIFDKFFTKFAYKFDKGYPDMNNAQDVLLLESLISEAVGYAFKLTETALSPTELSKDATLAGGEKKIGKIYLKRTDLHHDSSHKPVGAFSSVYFAKHILKAKKIKNDD